MARKAQPKKPSEAELVPHKIVGELIGKRLNEHGDIIGEEAMGPVAIFAANFGKLPQLIDKELERAREAAEVEAREGR